MTQSFFFACGYTTHDEPGIHAFSFDEETGVITTLGSYTGVNSPSFLVIHPNKKWLYVVSETGQGSHGVLGSIWSFRFKVEPFIIQPLHRMTTRGDWPCHLRFDHLSKWLITTNYGTGNAGIYPIQEDGSLGEMTDFVQHHGSGPNQERQEAPHAHSSIFTPDNGFVIVADLGIDQLVIYDFDSATGKLQPHSAVHAQPGAGPRHLVFHPNGKWFYVANELASTVSFYEYDAANGILTEKQTIPTIPFDAPKNIVADIHVSDLGQRLYVSNRGHNSIAVYEINLDGILILDSISACGGDWPRNFAIAPGGKFILVANQYSNEVCALPILDGKEALGAPVSRVSLAGASCVQFV
ncbi:MAG TPA: lactonase family protein [Anaerolineales bacterium]|nr:lactonase family protein [Anaerolineales bacterium]